MHRLGGAGIVRGARRAPIGFALVVLAIAGATAGVAACGGKANDPTGDGRPSATVTVNDNGTGILTNGFMVAKGEPATVEFKNQRSTAVKVELYKVPAGARVQAQRPAEVPATFTIDLAPNETKTGTVTFPDAGAYGSVEVPAPSGSQTVVGGQIDVE